MLSVAKETALVLVHARQTSLGTLMTPRRDVTESASRTTTVLHNWLALASSVLILARALVVHYPSVTFSNMFLCALVLQDTPEIHTSLAKSRK